MKVLVKCLEWSELLNQLIGSLLTPGLNLYALAFGWREHDSELLRQWRHYDMSHPIAYLKYNGPRRYQIRASPQFEDLIGVRRHRVQPPRMGEYATLF